MIENAKKIIIGSAQFGMDYGIANKNGQVNESEIRTILNFAKSKQIDTIDTASQYGESEVILGNLANADFKIITKLSMLPSYAIDINEYVKTQLQFSLNRLKKESVEGLLIHNADDLLHSSGRLIYHALIELKKLGKVKKIGVSVYTPQQVHALIEHYEFDIIQFPLNILDQRFLQNNLLEYLKKKNIELHARSLFLQGLLLMNVDTLPKYFKKIRPLLTSLRRECQQKNISLKRALIDFVISIAEVDYCVLGVDSYRQFCEIINEVTQTNQRSDIKFSTYQCHDSSIINPKNWKAL